MWSEPNTVHKDTHQVTATTQVIIHYITCVTALQPSWTAEYQQAAAKVDFIPHL